MGIRNFIILPVVAFLVIAMSLVPVYSEVGTGAYVNGHGVPLSPPITVVLTPNVTYKATTFVWSPGNSTVGLSYDNLSGSLRVHVNFDQANTTNFLNILQIINSGNLSGNMSVIIDKTARIGNYTLNSSYTSTLAVYISHTWQTENDVCIILQNNTQQGPFPLYKLPQVSYYIGLNYTQPQSLPSNVSSNFNALGQYISFVFTVSFNA
ncbi:MAG: hypothetical protein ACYCT2_06625 [Thermoplasmataceae archaeon]